jgi:2-hydroxychromene-2-carboxylate isomerase
MKLYWFFDFISPFAYLQHCQFHKLPGNIEVQYKPVLLAGLLNHWDNVGPAEIPPKRTFTYKHCYWQARKLNIPFKMPPSHPFNSLNALRLALAVGCDQRTVQLIFETIWKNGFAIDSGEAIKKLESELKVKNIIELTSQKSIKDQLRNNTEQAAAMSVFGVPTFMTNTQPNELFWGMDAFDMLLEYLDDPILFNDDEMRRLESLPVGIQRKQKTL